MSGAPNRYTNAIITSHNSFFLHNSPALSGSKLWNPGAISPSGTIISHLACFIAFTNRCKKNTFFVL